jgi:putative endonuclease
MAATEQASEPMAAHGPSPERQQRYRRGRRAELVAMALLTAKGYRLLARRFKCPLGEIDLIAVRGRRLAFVEVKRRPTIDAAEWAIPPRQQERIIRAAEHWVARHPAYRQHELGLDVILVVPWRWPVHLANAFQRPWDGRGRRC